MVSIVPIIACMCANASIDWETEEREEQKFNKRIQKLEENAWKIRAVEKVLASVKAEKTEIQNPKPNTEACHLADWELKESERFSKQSYIWENDN